MDEHLGVGGERERGEGRRCRIAGGEEEEEEENEEGEEEEEVGRERDVKEEEMAHTLVTGVATETYLQ